MELGLGFEDDEFVREEKKSTNKDFTKYQAKICQKEWFTIPNESDEISEKFNKLKFQADVHYRREDFQKALELYKAVRASKIYNCSSTVERELAESELRCLIKLGRYEEAQIELAKMLRDQEEDVALWTLQAEIHSCCSNFQGEIAAFQRCVTLHSFKHQFWCGLAAAYLNAHKNAGSLRQTNTTDNTHTAASTRSVKCQCASPTDLGISCLCINDSSNYTAHFSKDVTKNWSCYDCKTSKTDLPQEGVKIKEDSFMASGHLKEFSKNRTALYNLTEQSNPINEGSKSPQTVEDERGLMEENCEEKGDASSEMHSICVVDNAIIKKPLDTTSDDCNLVAAYVCLLRARDLARKSLWGSSSFVKEKTESLLVLVKHLLEVCVLCRCGNLKEDLSKLMKSEEGDMADEVKPDLAEKKDFTARWLSLALLLSQEHICV
ncbi:predicted protein [Nematostella vectensis]|uniref:Uncharacterized protein n=1 Tax=Nematostella vectensis TaxID=45351 RepID=A7RW69_NEMVE|nr:uncharacterized protein C8orf76 homolog [Nematostella vectensis]EDO44214.1 predicted protein [Nematostella vectensis]|eukprot:XP_001636277.1 predicted protein [Nematostella vectensis]